MKKIFLVLFVLVSVAFAQSSEMDPEAGKFYNAGNSLLKSGDYQGAIENYNNALKTSKSHKIYYQKGMALKKLKKYDDAIVALQSAIESNSLPIHIVFLG